jgi:hypothetical protein
MDRVFGISCSAHFILSIYVNKAPGVALQVNAFPKRSTRRGIQDFFVLPILSCPSCPSM